MPRTIALLLIWLIPGWAGVAAAQTTTPEVLEIMVVTGTGRAVPLRDQAGNTKVLEAAELALVRHDHISEALNRVSGVMIQRGNGQEHLTAIRSPVFTGGAGAGSFLYLEDGIPLRAAGFANVNGLFEANTETAGRIEVVRGPGSALYGSNAVHGLVNVLTAPPAPERQGFVDLSAGPHGLFHVKAGISDTIERHGYRVDFILARDGGYRADSGFNQQKGSVRYDYRGLRDNLKMLFAVNNLDQETAGFITGFNAFKNRKTARGNPNPEAFRDAKSFRLSARWERELANGNRFSLTPYGRYVDMDLLMHFLPGRALEESAHKSLGLAAAYHVEFGGGHSLVAGLDVEYTRGSLRENQTMTSPVPGFVTGIHYDYQVDALSLGPYLHSEWRFGERARLTAGLRFEHMRYEYDNRTGNGVSGRFLRIPDRVDSFNNATPKLGITYRLNESTTAYLNLARAARAPQTTDLYRLQSRQQPDEVRAEHLNSAEAGLRGRWSGLTYTLTAYYMVKKNFFFRDVDGFNVADGRTRHRGLELELFANLPAGFEAAVDFSYARHSYDFTNDVSSTSNSTERIRKGDDVDTAPRTLGHMRLGWRSGTRFHGEVEWVHVGAYYTDASNLNRYRGHDLLNLRARFDLTGNLAIHGRITNLTNRAYAERADFLFGTDRYFPGEPRGVHGAFSYRF